MNKKSVAPTAAALTIRDSTAEFLIFTRQTGEQGIQVRVEGESIWLTQRLMAELFEVTVASVSIHLKNIFESGELSEAAVIKDFLITAADGKKYQTKHYNLDAVISVGYRVNSLLATQFRQWAYQELSEIKLRQSLQLIDPEQETQFVLYASDDETIKVKVFVQAETIWLSQRQMADLFHTTAQNILLHLSNIYAEEELEEEATCKDFLQVQQEGEREVRRTLKHYNLDAIIAAGYRVRSYIAERPERCRKPCLIPDP